MQVRSSQCRALAEDISPNKVLRKEGMRETERQRQEEKSMKPRETREKTNRPEHAKKVELSAWSERKRQGGESEWRLGLIKAISAFQIMPLWQSLMIFIDNLFQFLVDLFFISPYG